MFDDRSQASYDKSHGYGPGIYSRKRSSSREDRFPKRGRDNRHYKREDSRGDPYKLDYLVNLKQFQEYFMRNSKNQADEAEMLKRFQVYKENFTRKQNEKFFLKAKDSEWFREKYHPEESLKKKLVVKRAGKSQEFETALKNGEYDCVSFEAKDSSSSSMMIDKQIDLSLNKCLFLTKVADYLKREELEQVLKGTPGFKELVLSDPRIEKNMARSGWAYFEDSVQLEDVCKQLDHFKVGNYSVHVVLNNSVEPKFGLLPKEMSSMDRIKVDLEQVKKLARALDQEMDITERSGVAMIENWMESDGNDEGLKKMKKFLDLIVFYLMKVHQYDYYGGIESGSMEEFVRKVTIMLRPAEDTAQIQESVASGIDSRIELRMNLPNLSDEKITQLGGRSLTRVLDSFLASYVKKESETKYRCVECQKLFKGDEYVKKHLKIKHPELVKSITTDTVMFNAYILDPSKIDPVKRDRADTYNGHSSRYDGPPRSGRSDPRQIRSYEDLDAPEGGDVELNYD